MTMIMQASSAAMAATLTALFAGAIDFEQAAYLVIGQNVGTTATALFAAIGASVAAKRTAMTHFLFNAIIAVIVTFIFPYFLQMTKWTATIIAGSFDETLGLALFHTFFSVFGAILFLPFIKPFAKLLEQLIPERENALTRNLDDSLLSEPSVAIDVAFQTARAMIVELIGATQMLISAKKVTITYERKMLEVEEAVQITQKFLNDLQMLSKRDRNKLVSLLHTLDHVSRLLRVLREKQSLEAIYVQERLMTEWQAVLIEIQESLEDESKILDISILLEQKSQQMAQERRERRNQYFERSVNNETAIDVAVAKVEAILWIDRLIFHFWRATARMAEYQKLNNQFSRHND